MPLHVWLTFIIACFLISITPGAGAFASMSSGAEHGFRHGYWTVCGLQMGLLVQIIFVAAGLGALIAASQTAFVAVKWLGVSYLVYLGFNLLTKNHAKIYGPAREFVPQSAWSLVRRGFLVNTSNPKSIVFLLAVLPQFITPRLPLFPQYAAATATMLGMDSIIMAGFTALGARLLVVFGSVRHRILIDRFFGGVFFALAALLAFQDRTH
jgi:homoserine/homoserine lactone efflux protein